MSGGGSWREALADYVTWCAAANIAATTVRLRLSYLHRLALCAPAPFEVDQGVLLGFVGRAGWSAETRKSARAAVASFYRWAADTGRTGVNPAARLPVVRVPAGMPRPAPAAAVRDALASADPRGRLMVMLAAFAGLRCCEIARCHSDDVVAGRLRVVGKGGRRRVVPLAPLLLAELPTDAGWFFPSPAGGHLRADTVSRLLRELLAPYTAHTLRHRFASRAYEVTHDLRAVQELLGHSKPETTMRYTLVPDDALRAAVLAAAS